MVSQVMCDCIIKLQYREDVRKVLYEQAVAKKRFRHKLETEGHATVSPVHYRVVGNKMINATYSTVDLRYYDGSGLAAAKIDIGHSYCPFCGEKYPKENKAETSGTGEVVK